MSAASCGFNTYLRPEGERMSEDDDKKLPAIQVGVLFMKRLHHTLMYSTLLQDQWKNE